MSERAHYPLVLVTITATNRADAVRLGAAINAMIDRCMEKGEPIVDCAVGMAINTCHGMRINETTGYRSNPDPALDEAVTIVGRKEAE